MSRHGPTWSQGVYSSTSSGFTTTQSAHKPKFFFVSSRDHTFFGDGYLGALVLLLVGTPDSALDFVVVGGGRERLDHVADFFAGSARQKGSQVAGVVAKELTAAGKHGMLKG